jgi:hypothetical protein
MEETRFFNCSMDYGTRRGKRAGREGKKEKEVLVG